MKKLILFLALGSLSVTGSAQWTAKSNAPDCRYDGCGFSVNNMIYYGLGITCAGSQDQSFYKFDSVTNTWTTIAAFPGPARRGAFGMTVGSRAYVGMGIAQNGNALNDIWEYDPAGNTWTQKINFPGTGRAFSVTGEVNGKGYLATGLAYMQFFNDLWEYAPQTDTWTFKPGFSGGYRFQASAFSVNGAFYVLCGTDHNGAMYNDCRKYDPVANNWSTMAPLPGIARTLASAFAVNGYGYAGYGSNSDFYRYDPVANSWTTVAGNNDGAPAYDFATATATAGYCISEYVAAPDCWEYLPLPTDVAVNHAEQNLQIYPNPAASTVTIATNGIALENITVFDLQGKRILQMNNVQQEKTELVLPRGVYLAELTTTGGAVIRRKIVITG